MVLKTFLRFLIWDKLAEKCPLCTMVDVVIRSSKHNHDEEVHLAASLSASLGCINYTVITKKKPKACKNRQNDAMMIRRQTWYITGWICLPVWLGPSVTASPSGCWQPRRPPKMDRLSGQHMSSQTDAIAFVARHQKIHLSSCLHLEVFCDSLLPLQLHLRKKCVWQ